jgi:spore germination cell wall hydrolase CwlJ-like protein
MRNKIAFIAGFVFSVWFSFAAFNFVNQLPEHIALVQVSLKLPKLNQPEARLAHTYTQKDYECLRDNIYFEARNQTTAGMAMVGIVTIQRSRLPEFPSTICGVVYEHAQFSWTLKKHSVNMRNKAERTAYLKCGLIAQDLLINANSIDELYKNVAYYHKITIHPKWADSMQHEFVIEDHVFYSKAINEAPSFVLR